MSSTPFAKRQIARMFWHDRIKFLNKAENLREEGIDLIKNLDERLAEAEYERRKETRGEKMTGYRCAICFKNAPRLSVYRGLWLCDTCKAEPRVARKNPELNAPGTAQEKRRESDNTRHR
jgi:ribosomal protein L37AE/L43A